MTLSLSLQKLSRLLLYHVIFSDGICSSSVDVSAPHLANAGWSPNLAMADARILTDQVIPAHCKDHAVILAKDVPAISVING